MKRYIIIPLCIIVIAIFATVFFILQANSERLALSQANIDTQYLHEAVSLSSDGKKEFKIIASVKSDGSPVVIKLVRNDFGFWKIEYQRPGSPTGITAISWSSFKSIARYDAQDTPKTESVIHDVYCGNNAQKLIEIPDEMIPNGVILTVYQVGSFYSIHATSYSDKQINSLHISDILKELGCIP